MATSLAPVRGVKNQGRPWLTSERSTLFRDLTCGTALAPQRAYEEGLPPSPYVRLRRVATAADADEQACADEFGDPEACIQTRLCDRSEERRVGKECRSRW